MLNFKLLTYVANPKLWAAILLLDLTGIFNFITKYVFADTTYLKFLIIACTVDLITGITKVAITNGYRSITSKGLRDSVKKIISYGSFLIIIHILTHFEVNNIPATSFLWMNRAALEFLILVEVKSVYENIVAINPNLNFIDNVLKKVENILKSTK